MTNFMDGLRKHGAEEMARRTIENLEESAERMKEACIKNRICIACKGELPNPNTLTDPTTGKVKESAMCPACRKAWAKRLMESIHNLRGSNDDQ